VLLRGVFLSVRFIILEVPFYSAALTSRLHATQCHLTCAAAIAAPQSSF
jgi:hypothetical protein